MERFIADLVQGLDSGKIDRREFCKTVALAAAVYGAGDAARAQSDRGFKIIGINHISYKCPDYAKARDWYASVLNMKSESFLVTRTPAALPAAAPARRRGQRP
jgi:hypothetical protein